MVKARIRAMAKMMMGPMWMEVVRPRSRSGAGGGRSVGASGRMRSVVSVVGVVVMFWMPSWLRRERRGAVMGRLVTFLMRLDATVLLRRREEIVDHIVAMVGFWCGCGFEGLGRRDGLYTPRIYKAHFMDGEIWISTPCS